ncbi:PA14 domain-containing protein [Streptomyces sp. NBC_01549]|uniref:fibronectin type III domain-containing protein n=1 Tax=Streptomyces sp. NBC_01549 TaxID=2975874 RepID=UPI0022588D39|nr:PA14 domain-containing protein [Streptomyces sp. NBC_01549]MCX4590434.1 PA14 domain-containing protein [Streptomyces sp. NBC_01549]
MRPVRRGGPALAATLTVATAGGLLAVSEVPASATSSCASPAYKRQFYANTTFSGTPKKTDCDTTVNENWGTKAPASGLPKDNFGVRWTVTRDFGSGGPFALPVAAQDGLRVYLDGTRKIDLWKNVSSTVKKTVNVTIPSGKHTLRVDYANWTGAANVSFGYTPRTTATVDKVKPLTPTGIFVAYDKATGKARPTWAKNNEMDLAGYRLYRRLKGSTTWSRTATTTATSYTDTPPATGDTYYYEVRAYDKAGNESTGTTDQAVTTVDRTALAAPAGLIATSLPRGLQLDWNGVTGAVSYRVYRATSENGVYGEVGRTDKLSYLDTSAVESVTYYYRVTVLDAAGNESARSTAAAGEREDLTPPPAVTGLTVTPTEYGFELEWDKNPATDLGRYTVYRGELWGDEGDEQVCAGTLTEYLPADTTSYSYTTRPDGDRVCFFVDAIDTSWNSSFKWTRTAEAVVATELDTTPSVPTPEGSPLRLEASATEGDEGNQLFWSGLGAGDEESAEPAQGFRIYRWNPATAAYEKIHETSAGAFVYFDTGAKRGTTSYYWVTGVKADGTETLPAGDWTVTGPAR